MVLGRGSGVGEVSGEREGSGVYRDFEADLHSGAMNSLSEKPYNR